MTHVFEIVHDLMRATRIADPFRFTALVTDGTTLTAFRWSSDERPPSLYYREDAAGLTIVSEPIDGCREGWKMVPAGAIVQARHGEPAVLTLPDASAVAA